MGKLVSVVFLVKLFLAKCVAAASGEVDGVHFCDFVGTKREYADLANTRAQSTRLPSNIF